MESWNHQKLELHEFQKLVLENLDPKILVSSFVNEEPARGSAEPSGPGDPRSNFPRRPSLKPGFGIGIW